MTRKRKIDMNPRFSDLPTDMIYSILLYDDRFYLSKEGKIISRFSVKDHRYILLSKIPRFSCVWNIYYFGGNAISYTTYIVFLFKNKKNRFSKKRFSLTYYNHDENESSIIKVVFRNHRTYEESVFFV